MVSEDRILCLPSCQYEAPLQLIQMVYQHSVCQEPFWAVAYKNWALHQPQLVEQLCVDFHYTDVASATAILAEFFL